MPNPVDPLPPEVREALRRGGLIEAIKLLRKGRGLGLKEAKDLVDYQRRVQAQPAGSRPAPPTLPPAVAEALRRGNKLDAIRLMREQTGLGLKEAKDAVESMGPRTSSQARRLSPGEVPRSRVPGWLLAAIAAAAFVGLYFYLARPQ